jgi:DNA-binding Lrp family transcriptional regulator
MKIVFMWFGSVKIGMVDETSNRILKEYLADSRQSFREVARNIGVSSGTVASRVREMEEEGVIKKYTALLDYEKLGYELTVITEIIVSGGMMMDVGGEIAEMGQTIGVYNITGDSDIMVLAKFRTRSELSNFTKSILKLPYVERTRTHLVLNTIKEDFSGLVP